MKTFKNIMSDLHISKARVYQIIDKLPEDKKPLKEGGRYNFTDESIQAIKDYHARTTKNTRHENEASTVDKENRQALLDQLDSKDEQIKELNERLKEANQSIKQAQQVSLTAMENNKLITGKLEEAQSTIQQLRALAEPRKSEVNEEKEENDSKGVQAEETAQKGSESSSETTEKPKKKSWWNRLFQ